MKIRWTLLIFMVLSLILTACGGDDGGDAGAPVKDFFSALAKKDAEKAGKAFCKDYRDGVTDSMKGIFELSGDDLKIEASGIKTEVSDETDNEAMVTVTGGTLKMTMAGETEELGAAEEYSDPIKVIKEDGKWVICDPEFAAEFSF